MFLLPVMAVYAGIGLKKLDTKMFVFLIMCVALTIPLSELRQHLSYDVDTRVISMIVARNTNSTDMIYSDEPMIAYMARRRMPNTAHMWNGIGKARGLMISNVREDLDAYNPKYSVLVVDNRIGNERYSIFGSDVFDIFHNHYDSYDNYYRGYQEMIMFKNE